MAAYSRVYDSRHLQADCKKRDQLRNPALGNRVWSTFTFFTLHRRYRLRFDVSGFDVDSVRVSVSGERIVVRAARLLDSGERRDHIRKVREASPPAQRSAAQRMCERPIIHRVK